LSAVDPRWYETFFETDEWLAVAASLDPERTETETAFVAAQLPAGARVLDVACGTGLISIPLARRGFHVSGLDVSERVLEVARAEAPELDFRRGDMRELPWEDESFDAVINLWTAFGFFETRADDEHVLSEAARVLVPGGLFVLDTVNQTALLRGFRPQGWKELPDGLLMLEERTYDVVTGRAQARWLFAGAAGRRTIEFDHRVYTCPEYVDLLRGADLEPLRFFGDMEGGELTADSWRLIIVAERQARPRSAS
jgi:ubiquinone/menaquinone biosynthesis C-methylase UbiE